MVFPVPNPPGMAAVPPLAMGNRVSRIRCPVTRGREAGKRFITGRGTRMGHFWIMDREATVSSGWNTVTSVSPMV